MRRPSRGFSEYAQKVSLKDLCYFIGGEATFE
jgi:hypothetical protein